MQFVFKHVIYTYIYIYIYIHVCVCMLYTYIHTHTLTHTCLHDAHIQREHFALEFAGAGDPNFPISSICLQIIIEQFAYN